MVRKHPTSRRANPRPDWQWRCPQPPAGLNCRWQKANRSRSSVTAETGEVLLPRPAKRGKEVRVKGHDPFESQLSNAAKQFVVRRDNFKTVIAGYPWFLDWGRDSLHLRAWLALPPAWRDEVKQILLAFAKFNAKKDGTLPNAINGNDVSNRDTTVMRALWFAIVCEDLADKKFYKSVVDETGRTIRDVLVSIAENYSKGTPNGIQMDADSALIWSPSHFTWMDTNYPAGTPRRRLSRRDSSLVDSLAAAAGKDFGASRAKKMA